MQDHPSTPPMRYRGLVDGSPVSILIGTGATGIFVSSTLVESGDLAVEVKQRLHVIKLADKLVLRLWSTSQLHTLYPSRPPGSASNIG
eukprot:351928-Chlamydomonas_euryale.AAC.4